VKQQHNSIIKNILAPVQKTTGEQISHNITANKKRCNFHIFWGKDKALQRISGKNLVSCRSEHRQSLLCGAREMETFWHECMWEKTRRHDGGNIDDELWTVCRHLLLQSANQPTVLGLHLLVVGGNPLQVRCQFLGVFQLQLFSVGK